MNRLSVFNNITLDGYFVDRNGDMRWAYGSSDAEFDAFIAGNAKGEAILLFGRITYEMMAAYWPTPAAMQASPDVAKGMNNSPKVVFSRKLAKPDWNNTRLVKGDLVAEVRKLKQESGKDIVILGSGSIVAQLAPAGVIDEYQFVLNPIVLGAGRTMFDGLAANLPLRLKQSRPFNSGKIFLNYEPAT